MYTYKCAKVIGNDPNRLLYLITDAIWCQKPATHATVLDPTRPPTADNVGHYYCAEHAPRHAVRLLPEGQSQ